MTTNAKPVSFPVLLAGEALACGQTIRALVQGGRVPPPAVELLQRCGDWLVACAMSLPVKSYAGDGDATKFRAAELVTLALNASAQDSLDAFQALITAAGTVALCHTKTPVEALRIAVEALGELQQKYVEASAAAPADDTARAH